MEPPGVYVSLDLDWLYLREAPSVRTSVRGDFTSRKAYSALERVFYLVETNLVLTSATRQRR